VYIADTDNNLIRKVSIASQTITTLAGVAGKSGNSGDVVR
jgi:hypothetical protein